MPRRIHVTSMVLALCALGGASAWAKPPAKPAQQISELVSGAISQYDLLEFGTAKKLIGAAEARCRRYRLEKKPICARVAVVKGVLLIAAFKDRFKGYRAFLKALKVDPTVTIDKALSTRELEAIFESAKKEAEATRAKETPSTQPEPTEPTEPTEPVAPPEDEQFVDPRDVRGILHEPVVEAKVGVPVRVRCVVGTDVNASKVFLFYRPAGRPDWTPVVMGQTRGTYLATIPDTVVKPPHLDYYIEVRDGRGKPQIGSGNVISPHRLTVARVRAPVRRVRRRIVEDELEEAMRRRRRRRHAAAKTPTMWVGLTVGSGVGWVSGTSDGIGSEVEGGFASAPLHLSPEFGLLLGESFALAVHGRIQVLTSFGGDNTADGRSSLGYAGLLRGYYLLGGESLRPYLFLAVGGGHVVHPADVKDPNQGDAIVGDTFKAGPFLVGPGVGTTYEMGQRFALVVELATLAGLPTNSTFNFDLNLGLITRF